jgi:hypothetical protein
MSSAFCCRRPRTISPILEGDDSRGWTWQARVQPSKLSRPGGSTSSRYTFRRADDLSTLKAILGNTSEDGAQKQMLCSDQGIPDGDQIQQQQELQPENSGSFSILKSKIRKKLSRNLASSSASVGGMSPPEAEQQVRYREELGRRLQEDLLTDKGAEEGGYDVDARFIETPVSTDSILEHLEGSRQTGVNHLTKEFQRTQMSWCEPDDGQHIKAVSGAYSDESRQW